MSKTLFLSPPSFDGFDGGAGARYQARREVTSYWYPTWLAQPAALVPGSKLLDCAPHNVGMPETLAIAKDFNHVIINTSTPSLKNDCKVAEAIKAQKPDTKIGFVGAHTMVLPTETLKASPAIDWVGRKEFDFTCKEVAEDRDLSTIAGLSYKDKDGKIKHNAEREMIQNRSRNISSAICCTRTSPCTPAAAVPRNAPSASGPRPSAGTSTVCVPRKMSPMRWPT
jgi:hypothetical protein